MAHLMHTPICNAAMRTPTRLFLHRNICYGCTVLSAPLFCHYLAFETSTLKMTAVVNLLLVFLKHNRRDGTSVVLYFLAVALLPAFADRTAFVNLHVDANQEEIHKDEVGEAWTRVRGTFAWSGSVNNARGVLHKVLTITSIA